MNRNYEDEIRKRSDRFAAELTLLVRELARQVVLEALDIRGARHSNRTRAANARSISDDEPAFRNDGVATSKDPPAGKKRRRRASGRGRTVTSHPMGDALAELERRIVDYLAKHPGASTTKLRALTGLDERRLRPVLTGMKQRGLVVPEARGRRFSYWLPSHETDAAPTDAAPTDAAHTDAAHTDAAHIDAAHIDAATDARESSDDVDGGAATAAKASVAPETTRPVALWEQLKPGVLEQLRKQPGAGLELLASALDQEPLPVHKALRSLLAERRVRRLDGGWAVESRNRRIVRAETAAGGGPG